MYSSEHGGRGRMGEGGAGCAWGTYNQACGFIFSWDCSTVSVKVVTVEYRSACLKSYVWGGGVMSLCPTIPEKDALLPGRPCDPTHGGYISVRSSHIISAVESPGTGPLWIWWARRSSRTWCCMASLATSMGRRPLRSCSSGLAPWRRRSLEVS